MNTNNTEKANNRKERWAVIRDNRKSTWLVSTRGRCKRILKKTGEVYVSKGSFWSTQPTYLCFCNDYVHRLVAKAFIPNPDNLEQVDHINSNRLDNRVQNLRWSTRKDNNSKKHANKMRRKNATHADRSNQILKAEKVVKIGDKQVTEVKWFKNGQDAAKALDCSTVLVYNAASPKSFVKKARGWTLTWMSINSVFAIGEKREDGSNV